MSVEKVLLILVIVNVTLSLQPQNIRLANSCPSRYKIWTNDGSVVEVEVKNSTGDACDRIPKISERKDVHIVNDLTPSMAVGSYGGINVVNITWKGTAIGNKLPKFILLELKKYVEKEDAISKDCVLLRIRNRKLKNPKVPATLYFDCVQLLNKMDVHLGVQVWCLSSSASVSESCQTRHKRSMPTSRTCKSVFGKMVCSEDEWFPLSIEDHIPAICHCSDLPNLNLERLDNGSFQLDAWNLPQYAFQVTFEIYRGWSYQLVYKEVTVGTKRVNESRRIITEKVFGPGNYTLVVFAECGGTMDDILRSGRDCPEMQAVRMEYPLEVPYPITTLPPQFQPAVHTFLPVGAAVISSGLVAVVVFLLRRKWNKKPIDSHESPERRYLPRDPWNNISTVLPLARSKSEKMLIYHPDNEYHKHCVMALQNLCHQSGISLVTGTESVQEMSVDKKANMANHADISKKIDTTFEEQIDTVGNRTELCRNWRDFAETAGTEYPEIVIIMSEGLFQICEAFWNKSSKKDDLDALRKERQYEIIPCVVLQKVQTLIQENPERNDFCVHFISFAQNANLIEQFLNTFNFLKRCPYSIYCLSATCKGRDTNKHELSVQMNTTELKHLLQRLKGLRKCDEDYAASETKLSNQNLGTEELHALLKFNGDICESRL